MIGRDPDMKERFLSVRPIFLPLCKARILTCQVRQLQEKTKYRGRHLEGPFSKK